MQRAMKLKPSAGPHPARQRHGRKKAASLGMAVRREFRLPMERQKVQPMPKRRKRVTLLRSGVVTIESRGQSCDRSRAHQVRAFLCPANPFLKCFEVQYATIAKWLT